MEVSRYGEASPSSIIASVFSGNPIAGSSLPSMDVSQIGGSDTNFSDMSPAEIQILMSPDGRGATNETSFNEMETNEAARLPQGARDDGGAANAFRRQLSIPEMKTDETANAFRLPQDYAGAADAFRRQLSSPYAQIETRLSEETLRTDNSAGRRFDGTSVGSSRGRLEFIDSLSVGGGISMSTRGPLSLSSSVPGGSMGSPSEDTVMTGNTSGARHSARFLN